MLLIGDRVVLRANAPPEAEYILFEIGDIELRSSEPGRVREHGYQTTVERARARCGALPNVRLEVSPGRDLASFGAASFDLVLAVDTFPYLVQSALRLAETHVAEAARVLRPGGSLVILNFSYRGDRAQDAADVARFARAHGLRGVVEGATPFEVWDGRAWRLVRGAVRER